MLPRKTHLEQINRFHDVMEEISEDIKLKMTMGEEFADDVKDLTIIYFELTHLWNRIDDMIEGDLKIKLDNYTLQD